MKEVHKTSIGGQALIEGILMRGPGKMSIVVRRENGEMVIKEQVVVSLTDRYPILKRPFIRGIIGLFESMKLGMAGRLRLKTGSSRSGPVGYGDGRRQIGRAHV